MEPPKWEVSLWFLFSPTPNVLAIATRTGNCFHRHTPFTFRATANWLMLGRPLPTFRPLGSGMGAASYLGAGDAGAAQQLGAIGHDSGGLGMNHKVWLGILGMNWKGVPRKETTSSVGWFMRQVIPILIPGALAKQGGV